MHREQDIPFIVENGVIRPEQDFPLHDGDRGILRFTDPTSRKDIRVLNRNDFWTSKTVEQLAAEQGVKPGTRLSDLRGDWPEDESIDEFLAEVRRWRQ